MFFKAGRRGSRDAVAAAALALAAAWWLWQLVSPARGQAPVPSPLALVGQAGGAAGALAADRDRVVLAVGQRLRLLDAADPAAPRPLGQSELLPGTVRDLALGGGFAFAALGPAGVAAVDLLPNPPLTVAIGRPGQAIQRVAAADGLLFALGPSMLYVLDPASLSILGHTYLSAVPEDALHVPTLAAGGGRAYVGRWGGMDMLDVTDPAAPALVGWWSGAIEDLAMAPDGRHVLVAATTLRVLDTRDPLHPRVVAEVPGGGAALAVAGQRATLVRQERLAAPAAARGLQVVDLADPTAPRDLGFTPIPLWSARLAATEQTVLLASQDAGLLAYDATDPARILPGGGYETRGATLSALAGPVALTTVVDAEKRGWLRTFDVVDPAAARPLGGLELAGATALGLQGTLAYVGEAAGGLAVVDLADPARPRLAGGASGPDGGVNDIALTRRYAYLATVGMGLAVYDLATPAAPRRVAGFQAKPGRGVAVAEGRAYLAAGPAGLVVLDVRDPTNPRELGRLQPTGAYPGPVNAVVADVAVEGKTAYLALERGGLRFVDVADPARMKELGGLAARATVTRLALMGDWLLATDPGPAADDGPRRPLRVVDRRDPRVPRELGGPALDSVAAGLAVDGERAALAAEGGGLVLLLPAAGLPATATLVPPPTATPRPRPTRPPFTPDPAWRRKGFLPRAAKLADGMPATPSAPPAARGPARPLAR